MKLGLRKLFQMVLPPPKLLLHSEYGADVVEIDLWWRYAVYSVDTSDGGEILVVGDAAGVCCCVEHG